MNNTNTKILYGVLIVIIIGAIAFGLRAINNNRNAAMPEGQTTVTKSTTEVASDTAAVRAVVLAFGSKMQNVNTEASHEAFVNSIRDNYGQYTDPQLEVDWETKLYAVPGRKTSSPWPARIEISSITQAGNNAYIVEGKVIEVTSAEIAAKSAAPAATYGVTIRVEQEAGGAWLITKFEQGPYDPIVSQATIIGSYTCLPPKDKTAVTTLECAYGIREDNASYFALDMSGMPQGTPPVAASGDRIQVSGTLTPIELLPNSPLQKYDIKGVVKVAQFKKL